LANKVFISGNEAVVRAALSVGAEAFFGYPITPSTEILHYWALEKDINPNLIFLQTEDEIAAGFAQIGSIFGEKISFTATAGIGNVLMQDAISMAEAMRLPFVGIIIQRGGPSTGTVIFSQQELNLTCFGGNGEGLRIVYSPSTPQELYELTQKSFVTAWKYQFPTFVLGDGYLAKTKTEIELSEPEELPQVRQILGSADKVVNMYNTYALEEDLARQLKVNIQEYEKITPDIFEYEFCGDQNFEYLIFAHGSIAASAKIAVDELNDKYQIGLFRPITLRPFNNDEINEYAQKAKKVFVIESSNGQFEAPIKNAIYGLPTPVSHLLKPALGITPKNIINFIEKDLS
jgi:2-oxoglutarate ferredoxin oxidoreductase subunit alpha